MANIVRAAIVQTEWTGDKDSMIDKHEKYARQAAEQGTRVMCFQELFNDAYFCQVQEERHMDSAESIPDGPTMQRMMKLAKETEMVLVVPIYEKEDDGFLYNTAAVIERDGTFLGKYRKTHIPHVGGFWEKFYFRPGNMGYPIFDTSVGGSVSTSATTATSRRAGGRSVWPVPRSSSTRRPRVVVCRCTCGSSNNRRPPSPTSISSVRSTGWARSRSATTTSTARRTSWTLGVSSSAIRRRTPTRSLVVSDLDLDMIDEVRKVWAFYRDRRPDAYGPLVAP